MENLRQKLFTGVDRRGHFQSVGDITTAQIFGLKGKDNKDGSDNDMHVPLMAVPLGGAEGGESFATDGSSDKALWEQEEPDAATLDSWATLGFSHNMCANLANDMHVYNMFKLCGAMSHLACCMLHTSHVLHWAGHHVGECWSRICAL